MTVIIRSATDRDGCRKWGHLPDLTSFEADAVDSFEEGARMLNVIACQAHLEDLEREYANEDATELALPKDQEAKDCKFIPLSRQPLWSAYEASPT